ncbi:MAG: formate/nitrite transporter family protein [Acidaminococcaceae bacterium]
MSLKPMNELLPVISNGGTGRTKQSLLSTVGLTFLAGAYIALGGFLAVRLGSALPVAIWGSAAKFIFAAVFPLGLMLVLLCGADLFTGNCMSLAAAWYKKAISSRQVVASGVYSWLGNFVGAAFVAYFMAYASGIIFESVQQNGQAVMPWASAIVGLANGKCALSFGEAFWRAVGCNWMVCIAIYAAAAAEDVGGKIMALWFPTMAFVAMGMEHCIANMFFVPLGIWTGSDPRYLELVNAGLALPLKATWSSFFVGNLLPVTLGNIVGGAVLVAGIYTIVHKKQTK